MAVLVEKCSWCCRVFPRDASVDAQGVIRLDNPGESSKDPLRGDRYAQGPSGALTVTKDEGWLCQECAEICDGLELLAIEAFKDVYRQAEARQRSLHRVQRDTRMRENYRRSVQDEV